MKKLLLTIPLGVALLAPGYSFAQYHDRDDRYEHSHRYYDPYYRDYHEWNENENRAWHRYREYRHRRYIEWERARERERRAYWRWRHEHPQW